MTSTRISLSLGFCLITAMMAAGCASLRETDRSLLNHPAMDLHSPITPERSSYLTTLGASPTQARSSGACLTCAH